MWKPDICLFVLLGFLPQLPCNNAGTSCEDTETAQVKLDLAKQSIISAKLLYPECDDEKDDSGNCTAKDRSLANLNAALDLISEAKLTCHSCPENKIIDPDAKIIDPDPIIILPQAKPLDCSDIRTKKSGVYKIWPKFGGLDSDQSIEVYCDMETDGGGWTVIQRRGKFPKQIDFYQDWNTYKNGFGDLTKEFWLGNEKMHVITNQRSYSVEFDLVDHNRQYRYALYQTFSIGDENSGYVLDITGHSGNATDDMAIHNGQKFSTKDRQNDKRKNVIPCTEYYHSAFWFHPDCGYANLNGVYQSGVVDPTSIWWFRLKNNREGLYSVEMKIRPNSV